MASQWERSPVVVGVDGSLGARRAVRFAAEEAAVRGLPLRIVIATPWPELRDRAGSTAEHADRLLLADADDVLVEAAELAEEILPQRSVTTVTAIGWPAAALVEESRQAELVVVGSRGLGGFSGLLLGSVGVEVSAHAECPVVVAREVDPVDGGPAADAPVVVGVDGGGQSQDALGAAFHEAELHGAPLLAVHAWSLPVLLGPASVPPVVFDHVRRPPDEAGALAEAVAPYREKHPDVQVVERVVRGHAAGALVAASQGARILVVGSRGRSPMAGLVLGSVSQAVIHHAKCPVLVVRSAPSGYDED